MIQVVDQNNTDLLLNPMATMERAVTSGSTTVPIYAVVQADVLCSSERVRAVLDWNDGTLPVEYPEQDSPLTIQTQRNLPLGTYYITLTAYDTASPIPNSVKVLFPWSITQQDTVAPLPRNIFGPILPRDVGLPNAQTWNWDSSSDLQILASNLKMLLITAKGERIMSPLYGTNIRRIIFELNVASVENILQQEIAQAVAQWEPRVILQNIEIQRDTNKRTVTVAAVFLSRQNSQPFEVSLQFTQ